MERRDSLFPVAPPNLRSAAKPDPRGWFPPYSRVVWPLGHEKHSRRCQTVSEDVCTDTGSEAGRMAGE
jgi:hypothetical protein